MKTPILTFVLALGVTAARAAEPTNLPTSPGLPARPLSTAIQRPPPPPPPGQANAGPAKFPQEFRSADAAGTNVQNPSWGMPNTPFLRIAPPAYTDGTDAPSGASRPNARAISNGIAAQSGPTENRKHASALLFQWGQFLDHDLDLSPVTTPPEEFDIVVPKGDAQFDPGGTGNETIPLDRTLYTKVNGVRQQINDVTAFIDASMVYGSNATRARALRTLDGTGRMKTSAGNLLPFNTDGLPNFPDSPAFFVAGDFRVNEQVALTAMQTLFVREHNYWAAQIAAKEPKLDDDGLYLRARAIVAAEIQAITYREFLPILLGPNALRPYAGYKPQVNPSIANEFATAAYRVGHTMLPSTLLRSAADGSPHPAGSISLAASFFNPVELPTYGIEPVLSGLTRQPVQEVDTMLVDEIRNFLFGAPGAGGLDLASLNIQRGRDHGLPSFNAVRRSLRLPPVTDFAQLTPDKAVQARFSAVYGSPADLDLWIAGLAEPHVPGAMVGPTFHAILRDQFERLRDGDRFWYESYLPPELVRLVNDQTLARIMKRNFPEGWVLPQNIWFTAPPVLPTKVVRR